MPTVAESRYLELVPAQLAQLSTHAEGIVRALDRQTRSIDMLAVVALYATSTNRNLSQAVQQFRELRSLLDP